MYANSERVPQNYAEVIKWFRLAANQGRVVAQANLGVMYHNGDGAPQNDSKAYLWFSVAAAQGNETAKE